MATVKEGEYIRVVDGYLEVRRKLQKPTPSSTGRTLIVFSTQGNVPVDEGEVSGQTPKVGINCYIKPA